MSLTPASAGVEKVTPQTLLAHKRAGTAITAITAYDCPAARQADESGIDLILVGDSLAMAVLGHPDTLSVTLAEMIHHARAVRRGTRRALLAVDMPFGSYHVSVEDTLRNAIRLVKESGAEAVKLEGGLAQTANVRALTAAQIPVIGHIGLTPQSLHPMGGFRVQGRTRSAALQLADDALALQAAGVIAIVLEGIPRELAAHITALVTVPTIGIGAGPDCDGQILVWHDLLQLTPPPAPKFVRAFADADTPIRRGLADYRSAVLARTFPSDSESYHAPNLALDAATLTTR